MTEAENAQSSPTLEIADTVLAKIAAFEAVQTPGVARLQVTVIQATRQAVAAAAKRTTDKLLGSPTVGDVRPAADPAAVDVDHDTDTGVLRLTVRVVASTDPPILQVVRDLHQRIGARITEVTGTAPLVVVNILDVDPAAADRFAGTLP